MAVNTQPNSGSGGSSGVSSTPKFSMSVDEFMASPDVQKALASLPEFGGLREAAEAKIREDYLRNQKTSDAESIRDTVPQVIEESRIDFGSEVAPYQIDSEYYTPEKLDPTAAIEALYNPENIERDKTGRKAQKRSLGYIDDLIANDGRDAVSDAYYHGQRADAEQAARAQREAALQNLEEQGRGSGAAALMTELSAASDLASNTHRAALGSQAMMQDRRDSANLNRADIGGSLQNQDDAWMDYYTGEQTAYGRDVSGITQQYDVNNWGRGNEVADKNTGRKHETSDANVGLENDILMYNKDLPWKGLDAYMGTNSDVGAGISESADAAERERIRKENEPNILEKGLGYAKDGAQIYSMGWGGPSTPHFNTETGETLYDPQTGKPYKKK